MNKMLAGIFVAMALLCLLGTSAGVGMIVRYHDANIHPFQGPADGLYHIFYRGTPPPDMLLLFWWHFRAAMWPLTILVPLITGWLILSRRFVIAAWCLLVFWTFVAGVGGLWLSTFNHLNCIGVD